MKKAKRPPAVRARQRRLAWLRVPAEEEIPGKVRALWEVPRQRLGFVPNVFRIFALRSQHLIRWWAYYDDLLRGPSNLTKAQREMIAVVVSAVNQCRYCMTTHSAALRLLTNDARLADRLLRDYRSAPLDRRERAMLDFAVRLTTASHRCTEADVRALRRAGWIDEDIMDIAEVAAMFNYTNRLANALGWVPNPEYQTLGR